MEFMIEEWKDLGELGLGIKPNQYYISSAGRLYSKYRNKFLKRSLDKDGYVVYKLPSIKYERIKTFKEHILVATAFIPNPENKPTVNHKDGNKSNNNFYNLEWNTFAENNKHANENGLHNINGSRNGKSILNEDVVHNICKLISEGYSNSEIKKVINIPSTGKSRTALDTQISAIRKRKVWNHISKDYSW